MQCLRSHPPLPLRVQVVQHLKSWYDISIPLEDMNSANQQNFIFRAHLHAGLSQIELGCLFHSLSSFSALYRYFYLHKRHLAWVLCKKICLMLAVKEITEEKKRREKKKECLSVCLKYMVALVVMAGSIHVEAEIEMDFWVFYLIIFICFMLGIWVRVKGTHYFKTSPYCKASLCVHVVCCAVLLPLHHWRPVFGLQAGKAHRHAELSHAVKAWFVHFLFFFYV